MLRFERGSVLWLCNNSSGSQEVHNNVYYIIRRRDSSRVSSTRPDFRVRKYFVTFDQTLLSLFRRTGTLQRAGMIMSTSQNSVFDKIDGYLKRKINKK
jgi:hypothetical protein